MATVLAWMVAGWWLVLQKVPSEANPKVRNHGEGPYYGLLLVESGYFRVANAKVIRDG